MYKIEIRKTEQKKTSFLLVMGFCTLKKWPRKMMEYGENENAG